MFDQCRLSLPAVAALERSWRSLWDTCAVTIQPSKLSRYQATLVATYMVPEGREPPAAPLTVVLDGDGMLHFNNPLGDTLPALALVRMAEVGVVSLTPDGVAFVSEVRQRTAAVEVYAYKRGVAVAGIRAKRFGLFRVDGHFEDLGGAEIAPAQVDRLVREQGYLSLGLHRTMASGELTKLLAPSRA